LEVFQDDIFVVEIEMSAFVLVLKASCEHPMSWRVMQTSYYFTKKSKLSGGNHVDNTWNVIKHLTKLLIADVVFLNLHYENVEYLLDATMEETFKSSKKFLSK
jgi:hypothetical protein